MTQKKGKIHISQIIIYLFAAVLGFCFVYPFWQTLVLSFSETSYANSPGFKFWPMEFSLGAYEHVFSTDMLLIGYMNTLIRVVAGTLLTLTITYCAAFAMSHRDLPGWSLFNFVVVFTMFFSGGLIPSYLNLKNLGILNTRWALILPGAAGAWNLLVMRSFLKGISKELEDAARIDGATPFQIMTRIFLPNSKAILAVVGLWSVVSHWNAWYDSMVYANKSKFLVLQTVIRRLIVEAEEMNPLEMDRLADITPTTIRCATIMVATLPVLLGYPFVQKYLVKGTMVGAIKG